MANKQTSNSIRRSEHAREEGKKRGSKKIMVRMFAGAEENNGEANTDRNDKQKRKKKFRKICDSLGKVVGDMRTKFCLMKVNEIRSIPIMARCTNEGMDGANAGRK